MWKKHPIIFLACLTLGIYFFSFFNQFVWDDEQFIYNNKFVKNFAIKEIFTTNTVAGAGESSNYYRPLTTLSFALDYQFWQLNPFGYHIVNTLLHLGAGILLYKLLLKLKFTQTLSFLTTLIFLIHPLQTEAVTYVNSRGDSLFSFFLMLSLIFHTFLFDTKNRTFSLYQHVVELKKSVIFFLILLTYLASILSKEIALAGLGLHGLVILRYFLLKKNSLKKFFNTYLMSFLSFFSNILIVSGYLALRSSVLNFLNTFNFYNETSVYSESLLVRLLTFFKIVFIYIKLVFIPYPLHMERYTDIIVNPLNGWLVAFILLTVVLAGLSFWQWKKHQETTILFGWAWIAIMLVPVSGIIAINGLLYEHWLYLPLIGFCIVTYETMRLFFPKIITNSLSKYFLVALIIIFSFLTIRQNYFWSTPIRLYTYLLQHTDSARIHNNLAMAYSEKNNYQEAIEHYNLALEYGIPYPQIYHNLGNTYIAIGDLENAEQSYKKALELSPEFFHTYINLIRLYLEKDNFDAALEIAHLAQQHYPTVVEYQLVELEILKSAQNRTAFENKKAELLQNYGSDSNSRRMLENLQLPQE